MIPTSVLEVDTPDEMDDATSAHQSSMDVRCQAGGTRLGDCFFLFVVALPETALVGGEAADEPRGRGFFDGCKWPQR